MKKLVAILLVFVLCISAAACVPQAKPVEPAVDAPQAQQPEDQPAQEPQEPAEEKTITIGATFMTLNSPFFEAMQRGVKEAAAAANVEVVISDAQLKVADQISSVEALIAQGVDAILLNAVDSAAIVPAVEACNQAGIPVICLDVLPEGGEYATFIASNNKQAGVLGGEFIGEYLKGQGTVVILDGPAISSFQDRAAGFEEALSKYEGIEIVAHINAVENSITAFVSAAENILAAYPDLSAVLAVNDYGAIAVETAVASAGKEFPVVSVGVDGMPDVVNAITNGKVVAGSVAQLPADMGRLGVETALKVLNGETVEKVIDVPLKMLSAENAAGFTW